MIQENILNEETKNKLNKIKEIKKKGRQRKLSLQDK